MDESGNNDGEGLLLVGGIATGREFGELEARVRGRFEDFVAERTTDLGGLASFERFRKTGFHAAEDPQQIQEAFFQDIAHWLGFKTFVVATDRSRLSDVDETERLLELYRFLLRDLLLRFRHHGQVSLLVEQNEQLRTYLQPLVHELPTLVRRKVPQAPVPAITATMVSKKSQYSLSIVDYVMAACARWMKAGLPRDPQNWTFRQFRAVQPSISLLYSLERGVISNRGHRIG